MSSRFCLFLLCCGMIVLLAFTPAMSAQEKDTQQHPTLKGYYAVAPLNAPPEAVNRALKSSTGLPLWTYNVTSSRDGNSYTGMSVGTDPSSNVSTTIPTKIVPLIFKMPDGTIFDPTQPDPCAGDGNKSDLQLFMRSPMVQKTDFTFGSVDVGKTQGLDAFQRAEYWQGSPNGGSGVSANPGEHTLLQYRILDPVLVTVPKGGGKSWSGLGCGNFGVINILWFDPALAGVSGPDFVRDHVLASLISRGLVGAGTLPIFFMGNVTFAIQSISPFVNCCIIGYHGALLDANGNLQTYSPFDWDSTGAFGPAVADTTVASHEIGEWANDPGGRNPTPRWGHVGQQSGCQGNFEVGDPLTGTNLPPITMPNGFTYHLQELAFFSWFYGAPSLAANGWFSDNNTFTTDAGAVCQ
jgi:hypothetical protein